MAVFVPTNIYILIIALQNLTLNCDTQGTCHAPSGSLDGIVPYLNTPANSLEIKLTSDAYCQSRVASATPFQNTQYPQFELQNGPLTIGGVSLPQINFNFDPTATNIPLLNSTQLGSFITGLCVSLPKIFLPAP